ncbi:T9SS type A sorting domain-containing protein [Polaribacter glomeratus]|uniref:Secretion system C-terminal sorting domain-containing protein n=1 Tax=Polaribacter glomeratus TaxID=102 RepID=A0A2S7WI98_9FLAO|nr:T9SS type A sorting domain-containing protein [Polaribacter glomeratus]PQJ77323.1 hypothetical protein BTO16_15920 [Polaribacter glomeratus]TXD65907.1 T9SS type A sorting domain-containing protein [Polaribacter glomeratus]
MKTKLFLLTVLAFCSFTINAQTIIPDANFEQALIDLGYDDIIDGQVLTANISGVISLNISDPLNNANLPNVAGLITNMTGIQDFTALQFLSLNNNNVSVLNVSSNLALLDLNYSNNNITTIDLSLNTLLRALYCESNNITTLNVGSNLNLEFLYCSFNQISVLDVNSNPLLATLFCGNNQLSALDVSLNTELTQLSCDNNMLTALDVSLNPLLTSLGIQRNAITALDVSVNNLLSVLYCSFNQLTTLNIANGNNVAIEVFYSIGNSNLTCITADASTPPIGLSGWFKDSQQMFSASCPLTYVPDDNLEAYLETHDALGTVVALGSPISMGNGIANDNYVFTNSINTVTNLQVANLSIADMTGIEDFTALEILSVSGNLLTTLDVSLNSQLEKLICDSNQITTLDVSSNTLLQFLTCGYNQISNLDVTLNTSLIGLIIDNNLISSIDVSSNVALETLSSSSNLLTTLNVSSNTALTSLYLQSNQITDLDVSSNALLNIFYCSYNQLSTLNIANGNNTGFATFDSTGNSALTCIYADASTLANGIFGWVKDIQHVFNADCFTVWTVQTNPTTTTALLAVSGLDADNNGSISLAEAAAYAGTLDLSGSGITGVEGLQAFTGIITLDVSGNGITDLSPLTNSTFSVIAKTSGVTKTIAKTSAMALETLILSNNNFEVIDLNSLVNLKVVKLFNNPNLITVSIQNGNNATITAFDSSNTPNLSCILVDDVDAGYLLTWTKDDKNTFVANEEICRSTVLAVDDLDLEANVFLFPNPVGDFLTLELSSNLQLQKVKVYSLTGKLIKEVTQNTLDFTRFSKGVYVLKIFTDRGMLTKKIIKQ